MIKHYYQFGYEHFEDTVTGEIVSFPEGKEAEPEDHFLVGELVDRWQDQLDQETKERDSA